MPVRAGKLDDALRSLGLDSEIANAASEEVGGLLSTVNTLKWMVGVSLALQALTLGILIRHLGE